MNVWSLTAVVTAALFFLCAIIGLAAHFIGSVLTRRQQALLVSVAYAAGFFTAVTVLVFRT